ncbi:MAG: DUF4335 domain-containing protein [Alkalinema sp. RU_4_3]|nr:DUF4335 domain-containing protein [Alkalinema sp. RU_4_3]
MTIKRQYSLPNCTLILEGFGDGTQSQSDLRPVMSILTNAECYLSDPTGKSEIIRGGKDFFESLITAVSHHAQEFLSGVHLPESALSHLNQQVQIQTVAPDRHRMTVTTEGQPEQQVEMSTVQFLIWPRRSISLWRIRRPCRSGRLISLQCRSATRRRPPAPIRRCRSPLGPRDWRRRRH